MKQPTFDQLKTSIKNDSLQDFTEIFNCVSETTFISHFPFWYYLATRSKASSIQSFIIKQMPQTKNAFGLIFVAHLIVDLRDGEKIRKVQKIENHLILLLQISMNLESTEAKEMTSDLLNYIKLNI